ncbi:MAG: RNA polymerase sigma factor [Opitutaceae bacterium]|nr:RNA polymerase sigma factor [Opitutaceae bacterium]
MPSLVQAPSLDPIPGLFSSAAPQPAGNGVAIPGSMGESLGNAARMDDPRPAETAFGDFYQATLSPLRRYLASVLGASGHEAPDIAHDAYIRTFHAMRQQPVEKPKAFLFTIARRLALNYRQRRASRMVPTETAELETGASPSPDPVTLAMALQDRAVLADAILALPPGCREVFLLRNGEDLSHAEIAERIGIARSTVEKQLARALRLLRERLRAEVSGPVSRLGGTGN